MSGESGHKSERSSISTRITIQFHELFPPHRRLGPYRRTEARVYDAIAASNRPGYAFYEFRYGPNGKEVDFFVWMECIARFAIQVKGGQYRYAGGRWYLRRYDGSGQAKPCPLSQTWDSAMAAVRAERDTLRVKIFVVPVLIFPDARPDGRTQRRVDNNKVSVIWGGHDLVNELVAIARRVGIRTPPTESEIRKEFRALTGDVMRRRTGTPRNTPPNLPDETPTSPQPGRAAHAYRQGPTVTVWPAKVVNLYRRRLCPGTADAHRATTAGAVPILSRGPQEHKQRNGHRS